MRYFGLFLLLWFANQQACGQLPSLTIEHLTTKEGLPSNDVWCINKDKQGFIWIGTGRNICRYDGYNFLRLDSLKLGYCDGISTDSKGDIYTSVDTRGICRIDAKTLELTTLVSNNFDDADPNNDLHQQSLVDSYDQVWVCDYTSVKRYDPLTKKLHRYSFTKKPSGEEVYQYATFFEDKKRRLWVVSELGLYRYDRKLDKIVCVLGKDAELPSNRIPIMLNKASADSEGNLWLAGYDYGLVKFNPENQSYSVRKQGFEHNNVLCVQESQDENGRKLLFVGTSDGVSVLYPEKNELYHLPEFYNNGIKVKDMFDDKANGILWIGTKEGLYKYHYLNVGIRTMSIPPGIVRLPVQITAIQPAEAGTYLLGLSHTGVMRWEPAANEFNLIRYPLNALTQQVRWLRDRAFAFTDKGIFVANAREENFNRFKSAEYLFKGTDFRDGLVDRKGRFWIASQNEGLKVIEMESGREVVLWPESESRN